MHKSILNVMNNQCLFYYSTFLHSYIFLYSYIWGKQWHVDFNAGKTQLVLFDRSNNNGSIGVKKDGSVLEENCFLRCWG